MASTGTNLSESLYDRFLPQAQIATLSDEHGPRVTSTARAAALLGVVSFVLVVVELVTVPAIATLISWHIIVGVVLSAVVLAKLAYSGVRFIRFYAGDPEYVAAGPPWLPLRYLAPPLAVTTVLLLGSGLELTFSGVSSFSTSFLVPAHTLVAIVWLLLFLVHAFAYLRRSTSSVAKDAVSIGRRRSDRRGGGRRLSMLAAVLVVGALAAASLSGQIRQWEHAFASGVSTVHPASSLIPVAKSSATAHELYLLQQRVKDHLNDVKSLHR